MGAAEDALKALASNQDGLAFTQGDQRFGNSLAQWVKEGRTLTPGQLGAAMPMLARYAKELASIGITVTAESKPVGNRAMPKPEKQGPIGGECSLDPKTKMLKLVLGFADQRLINRLKIFVPEIVYVAKEAAWFIPVSCARQVRDQLTGTGIVLDSRIDAIIAKQEKLREMGRAESVKGFDVPLATGQLMDYQKAGVKYIEMAGGRALIADDMGLGKTLMSLAYLELNPRLRPAIIVCPSSLKINWSREIKKWMTGRNGFRILSGQKPEKLTGTEDIYIINYDVLSFWVQELLDAKPAIVVADECHYIKNKATSRSKAFGELTAKIEKVILATGTPISNRPAELWTLLNIIAPHAWPSFYNYALRYCNGRLEDVPAKPGSKMRGRKKLNSSGSSNLQELHDRAAPYMIRRLKTQVLKQLPKKRRAQVAIEMSKKHQADYEEALWEAKTRIEEAKEAGVEPGAVHLELIEKCKQIAASAKLEGGMIEWIKDFIESGEKLILFATHRSTIDRLMAEFKSVAVKIDGSVSIGKRQEAVDEFQNNPGIRLFVGNIKAAGVGLTLTAASNVLFMEYAWAPGDHDQAEDRANRIGQTASVTCYYTVAVIPDSQEKTVDEDIADLLEAKLATIHRIVDGTESPLSFTNIQKELVERIRRKTINRKRLR